MHQYEFNEMKDLFMAYLSVQNRVSYLTLSNKGLDYGILLLQRIETSLVFEP